MKALYTEALTPDEEAEFLYGCPNLDANQRQTFDRITTRLFDHNPMADSVWLMQEAARQAREYVDTAQVAATKISESRLGPAYCYMAFHGLGQAAMFVKIGMTRHPERRLYGMATGNPLDCLWVFVCRAQSARAAYRIEQAVLRHLEPQKRRGEWVTVEQMDADRAAALARSMGGLAKSLEPDSEDFVLLGYTDGR